jgi:hypothetical protein
VLLVLADLGPSIPQSSRTVAPVLDSLRSAGRREQQIPGHTPMSDIGLDWGPLDWAEIALFVGAPGLVIGALLGAILWRRHRLWGALVGAVVGLGLWDAGFVAWMARPWS